MKYRQGNCFIPNCELYIAINHIQNDCSYLWAVVRICSGAWRRDAYRSFCMKSARGGCSLLAPLHSPRSAELLSLMKFQHSLRRSELCCSAWERAQRSWHSDPGVPLHTHLPRLHLRLILSPQAGIMIVHLNAFEKYIPNAAVVLHSKCKAVKEKGITFRSFQKSNAFSSSALLLVLMC